MARVVAFVPDLLFGSNVVGALSAAGHEPVLASNAEALRRGMAGAELLIVDLTADARSGSSKSTPSRIRTSERSRSTRTSRPT